MSDTIAALATAAIKSGVAVIRISGDDALDIARRVFRPMSRGTWKPRIMTIGTLHNMEGNAIDSILAVWFKAPRSYTGENVVEFHCHGSLAVMNAALAALYSCGARPAEAGEFTKRAFINGKLDLSQAEAVGDLIEAGTEEAAINATAQIEGALSRELVSIYDALVDLLAHFQAVVDYPDEDIEQFGLEKAQEILHDACRRLELLTEGYQRGKVLKEGIDCAIIGRPNVGKSSLMNALVGYERAIVTPLAGTTRDVVEAYAKVGGVVLKLHDTAGIRETDDCIENIGVERAIKAARAASLVLAVIDGSRPLSEEDHRVLANVADKKVILLVNKCDLAEAYGDGCRKISDITESFAHVVHISAKTGAGFDEFEEAVRSIYATGDLKLDGTLITNARQEGACRTAAALLRNAASALAAGYPPDMVLYDVEQGMERIGEILGRNTPDEVIDRVFANFCVGK